ncbi:hypothetical protein DERF_016054 [Dermatophagoides farinae]|uniref:Protein sleepless n=1 Tax=Dermatophagoides farinae TaxID=6954 RepID=A0A922HG68_DERFA|nr:uncharacterized protein LOC124497665 [Dermatophagoides farinae]KAH7643100.1 hypothetical protein HUG17_9791 [Dermatophagoides farinae]KAH9491326.1 hypothetical protein DERF_016054 [Dermatophagoides farinae]
MSSSSSYKFSSSQIAKMLISLMAIIMIMMPLSTMAIKCWDCNSMINKGCDDPFKPDDFAMADCSQKHLSRFPDKEGNICRKTLQKINDEYRIIRGCGYINDTFDTIPPGAEIEDQCLRRTGTFSVMVEYCICNGENGCNHATFISINNTLLLIIMLPLLIIIMMAK